jgi:hypothetical protein
MPSLILILVTGPSLYLLDVVLMGLLLYVLRDRYSLKLSKLSAALLLLMTFVFYAVAGLLKGSIFLSNVSTY